MLGNIYNVKTFVSFYDWYLNLKFSITNIFKNHFYFQTFKLLSLSLFQKTIILGTFSKTFCDSAI